MTPVTIAENNITQEEPMSHTSNSMKPLNSVQFVHIVTEEVRYQVDYYEKNHVTYGHCLDLFLYINDDGSILTDLPRGDEPLKFHCYWNITDEEIDRLWEGEYDDEFSRFLSDEAWPAYLDFVARNCSDEVRA